MQSKIRELRQQQRRLNTWIKYNEEESKMPEIIVSKQVLENTIKKLNEIYVESKILKSKLKNRNLKREDRDSIEVRVELLRLKAEYL